MSNKYAVILAGGSGQRLWPLSRINAPKQLIELFDNKCLLELCIDRIKPLFDLDHIIIITNNKYAELISRLIPKIPIENILEEPVGRDTANAIALASGYIANKAPNSYMAVFSADQIIYPIEKLTTGIKDGFNFLKSHPKAILTLGINAKSAHTGYGYLKKGKKANNNIYSVDQFIEKPNIIKAKAYIDDGGYSWNSGMFLWKTSTILSELDSQLPYNYSILKNIFSKFDTQDYNQALTHYFPLLNKVSIDYGIMENASKVYMIELDCEWKDVGSFEMLVDAIGKYDNKNNASLKNSNWVEENSTNNIILNYESDHLIAGINIKDLVIVHTKDVTLISHKNDTDKIKHLIQNLNNDNKKYS